MTTQFAGLPVFQFAPWMLGVASLFGLLFASVFTRMAAPRRPAVRPLWDITRVAQMYTTVVGALAGFAAASAVFVARLGVERPSNESLETTVGLFILAFLMLATSAMEFANTPNASENNPEFLQVQRLCFLIANVTLTQGICTGWLALRSLTMLINLPGLSDALGALLLIIVVLAAARLGQYLLDLTSACTALCLGTPVIALGGAFAYAYGIGGMYPAMMPTHHLPLHFAVVGTLVAATGFSLQSVLFTLYGQDILGRRGARVIEQLTVGHTLVTTASFGLLAITVAAAWS